MNPYRESLAVRTREEVAQILGLPRECVRQTEEKALAKLRKALLETCTFEDGRLVDRQHKRKVVASG